MEVGKGYVIIIIVKDEIGCEYYGVGKLFFDGVEIGLVWIKGCGWNVVEKFGEYEVEVGFFF